MKRWIGSSAHGLRYEISELQTGENKAARLTAASNQEAGPGIERVFGTTGMQCRMRILEVHF